PPPNSPSPNPRIPDSRPELCLGHSSRAEVGHFWRALKDNPRLAGSLSNLAVTLVDLGHLERAAELYHRALALRVADLGPDHPDVAGVLIPGRNASCGYESVGR